MTILPRIAAIFLAAFAVAPTLHAQANRLDADVDRRVPQVVEKVVAWRRDIHAHPELSNRETRTADLVAQHLRSLGIEVTTGVAHTGVVGVLRGGRPGPVVALRAEMTRCRLRKRSTCRSPPKCARPITARKSAS